MAAPVQTGEASRAPHPPRSGASGGIAKGWSATHPDSQRSYRRTCQCEKRPPGLRARRSFRMLPSRPTNFRQLQSDGTRWLHFSCSLYGCWSRAIRPSRRFGRRLPPSSRHQSCLRPPAACWASVDHRSEAACHRESCSWRRGWWRSEWRGWCSGEANGRAEGPR